LYVPIDKYVRATWRNARRGRNVGFSGSVTCASEHHSPLRAATYRTRTSLSIFANLIVSRLGLAFALGAGKAGQYYKPAQAALSTAGVANSARNEIWKFVEKIKIEGAKRKLNYQMQNIVPNVV
jgi:hypothetical protein